MKPEQCVARYVGLKDFSVGVTGNENPQRFSIRDRFAWYKWVGNHVLSSCLLINFPFVTFLGFSFGIPSSISCSSSCISSTTWVDDFFARRFFSIASLTLPRGLAGFLVPSEVISHLAFSRNGRGTRFTL